MAKAFTAGASINIPLLRGIFYFAPNAERNKSDQVYLGRPGPSNR